MINKHYTQVGNQEKLLCNGHIELSSEGRMKTKENSTKTGVTKIGLTLFYGSIRFKRGMLREDLERYTILSNTWLCVSCRRSWTNLCK